MANEQARERLVIITSMVIRTVVSVAVAGGCFWYKATVNADFPAAYCLIGIILGNIGYAAYDVNRQRRLAKPVIMSTKNMRFRPHNVLG